MGRPRAAQKVEPKDKAPAAVPVSTDNGLFHTIVHTDPNRPYCSRQTVGQVAS